MISKPHHPEMLESEALLQKQPWHGGFAYFEIEDMATPRIHNSPRMLLCFFEIVIHKE